MRKINEFRVGDYKTAVYWTDLQELEFIGQTVVVCDGNTEEHARKIGNMPTVVLKPGEEYKQWEAVSEILKTGMEQNMDRNSRFIGVGGGVVTDLTAFASSLYMRGCSLSLVATSLLAMVDAAFGGKTGMDFLSYKNSVGTFYPAENLYLDISVLRTLPFAELKNGMAEVIKTALLGDRELLDILENGVEKFQNREEDFLRECVERCIQVKGRIVQDDLKEKGVRAVLNLGHTFGHALETISDFSVSHGAAVAWGIRKAAALGVKLGRCDRELEKRINNLLDLYGFELEADLSDRESYFKAMNKDKKKSGGKLRFVMLEDVEKPVVEAVDKEIVEGIL